MGEQPAPVSWADHAATAATAHSLAAITTTDPATLNGADLVDAITATEKALSLLTGLQMRFMAALAAPFTAGDPMRLATRIAAKNAINGDPCADRIEHCVPEAATCLAASEIAAALRISPVTAGNRVREAATMTTTLAPTLTALEQGRIDRGKTRVITEHCQPLTPQHIADLQTIVLPQADHLTTSELRDLTAHTVITIDPDGAEERHQAAATRRDLLLRAQPDAMATLSAFLPADSAVKIFQISDLLATSTAGTPDDHRGIGARRVDALVDIADQLLTHGHLDLGYYLDHHLPDHSEPPPPRNAHAEPSNPETTTPATTTPAAAHHPDAGDHPAQTVPPVPTGPAAAANPSPVGDPAGRTSPAPRTNSTGRTSQPAPTAPTAPTGDPAAPAPTGSARPDQHSEPTPAPAPADEPAPTATDRPDTGPLATLLDEIGAAYRALVDGADHGAPTPNADTDTDTDTGPLATLLDEIGAAYRALVDGADHGAPPDRNTHHRRVMTRQGRRPHLAVTINLDTLTGHNNLPAHLAGFGAIPASLGRAIARSAETITALLTDPTTGTPLHAGNLTYRPTQQLRDQISALTNTCQFPSCRQPVWRCDLDHREPFDHDHPAHGGPTNPDNTGPFCRRHHLLKHHTEWRFRPDPENFTLHWTSPTGHTYTKNARPALLPTLTVTTPHTTIAERLDHLTLMTPPGTTRSTAEELLTTLLLHHRQPPREYHCPANAWEELAQQTHTTPQQNDNSQDGNNLTEGNNDRTDDTDLPEEPPF